MELVAHSEELGGLEMGKEGGTDRVGEGTGVGEPPKGLGMSTSSW